MGDFSEVGYSASLATACRDDFKGYLHWGKVLAIEVSECTIKWQIKKEPSSILLQMCILLLFIALQHWDRTLEAPL